MRTTQFFPVLLAAMAMSLCTGAQQSSNYQLKEHDLNAGGVPKDGLALTSTNFKIAVGSFGDCLWATGMGSPNIQLVAGFPATTVPACTLTCTATVPDTGVPGTPVSFASTATPSNCTGSPTYDWDFGDGTTHGTAQNPTHTYAGANSYDWTLTVAVGGVTCTKTGTILVSSSCALTCTATVPDTGVPGTPVSFASTATPSNCTGSPTYDWDFGDGTTHGTAQNPTHTYAGANSYDWTLTVAVGGVTCTKTGTILVSSSCALTCTATVPDTGVPGTPVSFASTATPSNCTGSPTYDWDFGDGTTHGTAQNPTHTYAGANSYDWTLTVAVGGVTCTKTGTILVSSSCALTCTATVPAGGTVGLPVAFASIATPVNCPGTPAYDWNFGDGSAHSSVQSPSHTYASAGPYTWTLTVSAGGVTCTKTGTVTAVNPPVITLMKKVTPPFKIVVTGTNLQSGIRVFIDGAEWTSVVYKKSTKIQITGGTSLKIVVPKGVPKTFRFLNPDGGEASMTWSW